MLSCQSYLPNVKYVNKDDKDMFLYKMKQNTGAFVPVTDRKSVV